MFELRGIILRSKFFRPFLVAISIAIGALSAGAEEKVQDASANYHSNPVIAEIDGKKVRLTDVRDKETQDAALELYNLLQNRLPVLALDRLSEKHPELGLNPNIAIQDAEVERFYQQNRLQNRGTLEQLKSQIQQYLAAQKMQEQIVFKYNQALEQGLVTTYLAPPPEFLIDTNVSTGFVRGNPKAQVVLLEFSDYQCPFCARVQVVLDQLLAQYSDRVAFAYRHFPLPFHKEADEAAIAAECARDQGKFVEMHKLLFENQKEQFVENLIAYGDTVEVEDADAYESCVREEKYRSRVNADIEDGQAVGVSGTPGFFVGAYNPETGEVKGEMLSGARPINEFRSILDKYLAKQQ